MKVHEVLFIDLDETLYSKTNGLWQSISNRINQFIIDRLQISSKDAQELREYYLENYGTTLNGLLIHHNIDPLDYLDYVHDIPIEEMIQPEPEIREVLKQLPSKKFVFTNASHQHANRVL